MGTQSTCPLATLISGSSWEKIATNIVVSVDTNAPVKGTGKALGLIAATGKESYLNTNNYYGDQRLTAPSISGNSDVLGTVAVAGTNNTDGITGVHTDPTKSGVTATVTRTNLTINIWKRTA